MRRSETGSVMLEFVLVCPFIAIVLVLIFELGAALLTRQRTIVAVREAGLRYVVGCYALELSPRPPDLSQMVVREVAPGVRAGGSFGIPTAVKDEIIDYRKTRRTLWPGIQPTLSSAGGGPQAGADFGGLSVIKSALGGMVGTSGFSVEVEHPPQIGTLIRAPVLIGAKFHVVTAPWTYRQYPLSLMGSVLGSLGLGGVASGLGVAP